MEARPIGADERVAHPPLTALALSLLGWTLVESWLVSMHAGLAWHGAAAIPGLACAFMLFRRSPTFQINLFRPNLINGQPRRFNAVDIGTILLLVGTGALVGVFVLGGWILPLMIAVIGIHFVPWRSLRLCQRHFFGVCTIVYFAGGLVVVVGHRRLEFMTLPIAGWVLCTYACFALLESIAHARSIKRSARAIKAGHEFSPSP